ncbi:MAG: hypothetical protein RL660_2750 [Bacteroidota bacterium]|jgi:pimeloyl-ACP methyl ester carboxylesterase
MQAYKSNIIDTNGIKLHYIEYPRAQKPELLLLHGLSANAFAFNGLIEAGLNEHWHIYSVDFRGRGKSTKRAFAFSIKDHAKDIIELLDYLEIDSITLAGHSFGGLMSSYLAAKYPNRIKKVFILDAAPLMNPKAGQMLMPAISRVDKKFNSFEEFIDSIKHSEYMLQWDDAMLPYYKADVEVFEDGRVECISDLADLIQISTHVGMEPWTTHFQAMQQKTHMIVALDSYTLGEPLLPTHLAKSAFRNMRNAEYHEVDGNHQTMLFGKGAKQIVKIINS